MVALNHRSIIPDCQDCLPSGTHHLLGENHLRDFSIKQDRSSLLGLGEEQLFDRPALDGVRKHRHRIPIGKEDDPQIRAFAIDELPADKKLPRELNTSGKMQKLVDSEKQGVTTPRDTITRTIRFFVMLTASAEAGTACVTYAVRLGPINRLEPDEGADEHHQGAVTLRGQHLSLWLNTLLC